MIRFFFEFNGTLINLPVNPEKLLLAGEGNNTATEVVNLGEINLLRTQKLRTIEINSFFPRVEGASYDISLGGFKTPKAYIEFFESIIAAKKPCRLVVTDTEINMLVSIESFAYGHGAPDLDTYFQMKLKEYKPFNARVVVITETPATATDPDTVTVQTPTDGNRSATGFAIGDAVVVSGTYYYSSYGASPTGKFSSYAGKISHIVADKTRKYRYHITSPTGAYKGWVAESQMTHK